jgi:hypothetical protein
MALECNIDARGQAARLQMGILGVGGGALLAVITLLGTFPTNIGLTLAGASIIGGAFAMWEARMAWCVIRAMGFKTRL